MKIETEYIVQILILLAVPILLLFIAFTFNLNFLGYLGLALSFYLGHYATQINLI